MLTSVSSLPGSRPEKLTSRSGALGRREHEPVRRHAGGGAEQSVVGADLGDPVEFGLAVAEQHQPVGAGVGAVEDAEAVGRRLHLQQRPDLAVDDRERRKGLHHLGIGLMDQLAGQPSGPVEAEVAVLDEQRHLERRPLGQAEFALALVADDPQPRQPGVDAEPGDAHHVVVVPQQSRPLAHRVVEDGVLAGREQVFGPAVIRRRGERAVQMHDRIAAQCGRVLVGHAAAQPWDTLHRHPAGIGWSRSGRHHNRQRAIQLVAPLHRDRLAALGLDRRSRNRPVVAPDRRLGQVAVEAVRASANGHAQLAVLLGRDQPLRHQKGVSERGQRRGQCWGHALALPTFSRALLPARASKQGDGR